MTDSEPKVWTPPPPIHGQVPAGDIPAQPDFPPGISALWVSFDVPRMWDMLADEAELHQDCHKGWIQVQGLVQLSDLLYGQHMAIQQRSAELRDAWQSPAGQVVMAELRTIADSFLSDSTCARTTAGALDRILTAFGHGKQKMRGLVDQWDHVTTDWKPEWWDNAAEELNIEARAVMAEIDAVVRDNRRNILTPERVFLRVDEGVEQIPATGPERPEPARPARIPPVPGYDPLAGQLVGGAELAGIAHIPPMVPAVPGAPVSMLPIPPGSAYSPYGAAYILPGPGVGKAGYMVPMPPPPARAPVEWSGWWFCWWTLWWFRDRHDADAFGDSNAQRSRWWRWGGWYVSAS